MKINFLTALLSLSLIYGQSAHAEDTELTDFGLDEVSAEIEETETPALPQQDNIAVSETDNNKDIEVSAPQLPVQPEDSSEQQTEADFHAEMSTYIKELHLDAQQLVKAKQINQDGILHQKQILQSIEKLQEQAKALENKNLNEFYEILTPEQQETFRKLRDTYNKSLENSAEN